MAPATVDVQGLPKYDPAFREPSGPSYYKDPYIAGRKAFQAESETKGTEEHQAAKHQKYLPTWNPEEKYPALEPFEHKEHGIDADLKFPNLLNGAQVTDLTANIGAEVTGIQLSKLTDKGKDELARFVAEKKVVEAFRDQDFAELSIQDALDFGGYFGRHHIHPTSGAPAGYPEVHLVHRGAGDNTLKEYFQDNNNSIHWHSDVTYEQQPPGTTFLYLLDGPLAGGDTLFVNQAVAYRRLSPEFQKRLHGLTAIHSAHEQANNSRQRGGIVRREPITSEHPLVRTHPATGEKALFVNPQFTRRITQLKKDESDYLLGFLYDHVTKGADFQARVKWAPKTVIVWDNRVTAHTATLDWEDGQRRHLARITPQGEKPYETPFEKSA